jgi:multidrug efflux pump subunit AcrA (membrane-fusion protein)
MKPQINQIETTKVLADRPRPRTKATVVIVVSLIAAGALFAGTAALGIYSRSQWTGAVQQRTNQAARLLVGVMRPEKSTGMITLQLPGQTTPYTDAAILAQTSGYLRKWYFDIGARVKAGDVLAEIDTPEVDQVGRLQALEDFKILRAPFNGIVTARNTDIGAYIPAGSGTQLFRMAATSRLRVYVTVPQALSSLIEVGERAELTVDQFPGRKFPARVIGTAGAINSDAKRLLTELEVPNPTGELSSGTYVEITLDIPIEDRGLLIPAETLLLSSDQPAVAVVRTDNKVSILPVTVIRDLGTRLRVSGDILDSDQLIKNPSPALLTGTQVTVMKPGRGVQE